MHGSTVVAQNINIKTCDISIVSGHKLSAIGYPYMVDKKETKYFPYIDTGNVKDQDDDNAEGVAIIEAVGSYGQEGSAIVEDGKLVGILSGVNHEDDLVANLFTDDVVSWI